MMKTLLCLLSCLMIFACTEQKKQPNVIFILADDYGYTDLSVMGSQFYETPNIDKIANEGVIFTQGYASCRVCSPSRASIMSGKAPATHGITDWIGAASGENWRKHNRHDKLLPAEYIHSLPHEYTTMPEAFKEAGYTTFFAGKWHIGNEGSYPEDHGFDINIAGWDKGSPAGGYFAPYKNPKIKNGPDGENLSIRLANETAKFISTNKDKPFFAYLSFYAVHGPVQTTNERWTKYRNKAEKIGIAESGYKMERVLPIRTTQDNPIYAGLVESMDDAVGIVLESLKANGLDKNTIVVFTSDNGGVASGDNYSTSNTPLRGGKGYQWEGGIREPYFINVPWLKSNGIKCETPVTGTDFYPTLLDLAGLSLKPEEHSDGVSLKPLLEGKSINDRTLFWHYPHYGNQGGEPSSIIRKGDMKLIYYWEDNRSELYNLKEDIGETNNIADSNSELTNKLEKELLQLLKDRNARYPHKDTLYNETLDLRRDSIIINKLLPSKEKQRIQFLSKDWNPGNNWWGSTID